MRTYTLELKCDFDSDEKYEIVKAQMMDQARQILAITAILADKRKPSIALHSSDFFHGNEDLDITSDVEG